MAIELATAYVSIVPETTKLEAGIKSAFSNVGKQAEDAGRDVGTRLAKTASKAMKDGWRPDQDIMAGIPDTKLDRIGARIGQVIGKGVVGGLRAKQAGAEFGKSFAEGAGSVGLGKVISGWKQELTGGGAIRGMGMIAGKALSAGLTAGVGVGVAGIGLALTKGFERLEKLDAAKSKLNNLNQAAQRFNKPLVDVQQTIQDVTDSVSGTPYSLDAAFETAVGAVSSGVKDIKGYMKAVTDASAAAGTDLGDMGTIFQQIVNKGRLTGEELAQLNERFPATSWIQETVGKTGADFDEILRKGEVSLDDLQKAIEEHAPGLAKAAGNTLQGAIDNMQTSIARVGADFLSAVFGGPSGDPTEGLKSAVQRVTEMLNRLDGWIVQHKEDIRDFFNGAKETATKLLEVLGKITGALKDHPGLIQAAVTAFVAFETIKGIATVTTALAGINAALTIMPGLATTAAGSIAAVLGPLGVAVGLYLLLKDDPTFGNKGTIGNGGGIVPPLNGSWGTSTGIVPPLLGGFGGSSSGPALPSSSVGGNAAKSILGGMLGTSGGNVTSGGGLGGLPAGVGGGGRGYMDYGKTSAYIDGTGNGLPLNWATIDSLAASQGLTMTSGYRDPNGPTLGGVPAWRSYHGYGRAHDYDGTSAQNSAFYNFMKQNYGGRLKELIYEDVGTPNEHVHVAFDQGGWLQPGTTTTVNATGKPELILTAEQQQQLADNGIDPQSLLHGTSQGSAPGPHGALQGAIPGPTQPGATVPSADAQAPSDGGQGLDFIRSMGFIPASAGNTGVAGTSTLANFIGMGNDIVGGIIDTGTNLAQQAVSAAIAVGAAGGGMGAGAAAAPLADMAASYGIQLLGNQAKRISAYGFQMAGIGADALMEQLNPFGMPRWLGYDYSGFMPQLGIQQALTSTVEKMGTDAINKAFPQPGANPAEANPAGPVNPSTMTGGAAATPLPPAPDPKSGPNMDPTGPSPQTPAPTLPIPNLLGGLFDDGGMLPPGGIGLNLTNRPEPVLTAQQWDAIAAGSSSPGSGAPLVQNLYAQDMQDAIRQLEKVKRRDMMQYAGRP